jgi:hypothetical protein
VVELNRAIAIAEAQGPEAGLEIIDRLSLDEFHYLHAARGELLRRACRLPEAREAYQRARSRPTHMNSTLSNLCVVTPEEILGQPAKRDLSQLTALVKTRLKRMQYRPGFLDGFLSGTGLDFTPFATPPLKILS